MKCVKCGKTPNELSEYRDFWKEYGASSAEDMARDDGTYNRETGNFVCTDCYIEIGMPSSPSGWKAP